MSGGITHSRGLTESVGHPLTTIETLNPLINGDEHYNSISTTRILSKTVKDSPPIITVEEQQANQAKLQKHTNTINGLREWSIHRENTTAIKAFDILQNTFGRSPKVRLPPQRELISSIHHFFAQRPDIKVIVCDFGEGRAERREVCLGEIEAEFRSKPAWSTVRWIHAPLGVGLLHSSVEDLFFHTGSEVMGRPFAKAGRAGWPYLELETLDLRKTTSIRDARDILRIMRTDERLGVDLDEGLWKGDNNSSLKDNVLWRARYIGKPLRFLELAEADLPRRISEGSNLNMKGPANGIRTTDSESSAQSITRHAFFKDAYLARNPFRSFHRNDGFLLTMSPAAGVDYLNTNFPHYLEKPQQELLEDSFATAVAQVYRQFSDSGTDTWYRKTVEWFVVYLITEVGTTPHNIRQGYSVPSLMDAYDSVVHGLKQRRFDQWQRNETIRLVRAYLVCIDELTVLGTIFSKKLEFFQRLRKDVDNLELKDKESGRPPDNEDGETLSERISFAEHVVGESATHCKFLSADLRESMNSLFQLRSIEQNELAIIADTQNKALFIFTAVTIVFLPLSFFTSYFGMNLQGIVDTKRTEKYFWKVCGPVALAIVLSISLWAFRHRMRQRVGGYRIDAGVYTV